MEQAGLPGEPKTWREFRGALRNLMNRAEMTALAVERMSVDPEVRGGGAESISDATVGRKIADKDEPVDARSVRTIVVTCGVAVQRRGRVPVDADVDAWLRARTRLVEAPVEEPAVEPVEELTEVPVAEPSRRKVRLGWLAAVLVVVVVGVVAATTNAWQTKQPQTQQQVQKQPQSCASPDQPEVAGLTMTAPAPGTVVSGDSVAASGTVDAKQGESLWLMLHATVACKYYLVSPVEVSGRAWKSTLYVDPGQHGVFGAYVVVVGAAENDRLLELVAAGGSPFIERLPEGVRAVHVSVRCCS
ncbi:hypothetical protein LFM09_15175 [Lentzea alba]|uniref:hypothetical protein n=1 Tax=Lentzea alba TaxID=2714351 RepID=UPI0039BF61B9